MIKSIFQKISPQIKRNHFNGWMGTTLIAGFFVGFPLIIIIINLFAPGDEAWEHITNNLLPNYVVNTLFLMLGVAALVFLIGVSTAWLVSMYNFPGRKIMNWALILPIAIPAYILGFTWVGMIDYTSPLYVFLRNNFGLDTGQFLFFNILSLPGAILILSLSLYPYVYIIARSWFSQQSANIIEAGYSLGHSPFRVFLTVALPLARPSIAAGILLALMEVLNDYGLVSYFGVETFTTGIFTAWFALGSPVSAIKLSGILMVFVLLFIIAERLQRGQKRYSSANPQQRPIQKKQLKGGFAFSATIITALPVVFGFILPLLTIINWSIKTASLVINYRFTELLQNSFILAILATISVLIITILVGFTARTFPTKLSRFLAKFTTLGYAIPGAVLAVGILVPFLWLDSNIASLTNGAIRILITGTWFILVFAYTVRFMAVGYNSIESNMAKIPKSLDEAAKSLGASNRKTLSQIIIPQIKPGIIAASILVFIDVLKELPLTLILRPFNFDTLAIRAFEFASDERLQEAGPPSLIIILMGLLAVILLNKTLQTKQ